MDAQVRRPGRRRPAEGCRTCGGGTGLVGAKVVAQTRRGGMEPVVIARSTGVDLISGAGLEEALDGCDAVVDVSNTTTLRARPTVQFYGVNMTPQFIRFRMKEMFRTGNGSAFQVDDLVPVLLLS